MARRRRRHKYGAQGVTHFGLEFASKLEGQRYLVLREALMAGLILELTCHNRYLLLAGFTTQDHNGRRRIRPIHYEDDFRYTLLDGTVVVEDVKGVETEAFRLKRKMFLQRYPEYLYLVVHKHELGATDHIRKAADHARAK